jgi:hypothetical protein
VPRELPGPRVRGRCKACDLPSLYLADGGIVTCANTLCTDIQATARLIGYSPQ